MGSIALVILGLLSFGSYILQRYIRRDKNAEADEFAFLVPVFFILPLLVIGGLAIMKEFIFGYQLPYIVKFVLLPLIWICICGYLLYLMMKGMSKNK
ncbi:MAG: hypothetical protein IPN08_18010 [Bacteroidales bacterium]|nr:hypothetical protein [Bacteroidales bacterium]